MTSLALGSPASLSAVNIEEDSVLIDFAAKRRLNMNEEANHRYLRKKNTEALRDPYKTDDDDSDSEWTTFTDSFGRTRKCLKRELDHFLREDDSLHSRLGKSPPIEIAVDIPLPSSTSDVEHVSIKNVNGIESKCTNMATEDPQKEERMRRWAQVVEENSAKEHVHYRDVLFDEVREHGQAHFEFSRNEAQRSEQLQILDRLRQESTRAQKSAQEIKKRKQHLLEQRLNRIRERKGLPPPAEREEPRGSSDASNITTKIKDEPGSSPLPPVFTPSPSQIRPWDEGKECHGVPIEIPGGRRRSGAVYEDYIEKRRKERLLQFAPPTDYSSQGNQAQVRTRAVPSPIPTQALEGQREPTIVDLDAFLKTMRNLS